MKYWRKPLGQPQPDTRHYQVHIIEDRCKGCRFCIEFCPRHVLLDSKEFNRKGYHPASVENSSECAGCGLCEMLCPEFAIHVVAEETP